MILRRMIESLMAQNWRVAFLELMIIVVGVFIGLQVDTWNNDRLDSERREQIVHALVTYLTDTVEVQEKVNSAVQTGLAKWESEFAAGGKPAPYYFRHYGSDVAPDMWSTLKQLELTEMFDPVTLFDLTAYYGELDGVSQKYVRYVTFVEDEILPGVHSQEDIFYDDQGHLRGKFRANMDRLREHTQENLRLMRWAECLVTHLETNRELSDTCYRSDSVTNTFDGTGLEPG